VSSKAGPPILALTVLLEFRMGVPRVRKLESYTRVRVESPPRRLSRISRALFSFFVKNAMSRFFDDLMGVCDACGVGVLALSVFCLLSIVDRCCAVVYYIVVKSASPLAFLLFNPLHL
jgi:hypothetical protein